jgi:hypothetical protein
MTLFRGGALHFNKDMQIDASGTNFKDNYCTYGGLVFIGAMMLI